MKPLAETIEINGRRVGPGQPVYVIAEMSANHGHDYAKALQLVEAAAEAGADAVKIQTYTADTLTLDVDNEHFRIGKGTIWEGRTLYDLYREAYTPWDWQPKLKAAAARLGIDLFSTPYDATAVEFLETMDVPVYKIASFENVDLPLIRLVAATGKPAIMSTGMAAEDEVAEAVAAFREAGGTQLALLKCTSAYPAPPEEMNLRAIATLAARFGCPVGLSDHGLELAVPVAAVALGACVVEKHLTLSRDAGGPDAPFSLEPAEFAAMVAAVRTAEKALGDGRWHVGPREQASRVFRRSLFVAADMAAGEAFTAANVRSVRPGAGLHTRHLGEVLGCTAARDIKRGTPLSWDLVAERKQGSA
ncbi:MAG: pseudaminic acid synthase [Planctomycetes bacterium]|nr:pseudaminic acid synthase [Planctomycetota bacterium]